MKNKNTELAGLAPANLDAGQIFSGNSSGTPIKGYSAPCAYTPQIDDDYVFQESVRDIIVWFLNPSDPLYIFGPLGCGKTSCVRQLAARLNYPVFEITAHGRLEFGDMIGHLTVTKGNMSFEYGPLALAMRYGGIFLLNEIDLTSPDVAAGLNSILDGSPLCIAENGGELIAPSPMFRFIATANTNGGGDETGLYQGTQRQNIAFADRFVLCEMDYPSTEVEKDMLAKHVPSLPQGIRDTMVAYANEVRKLFMGDGIDAMRDQLELTFSTRSLLRWADLTLRFQALARQGISPVTYALDRALAFRANRESRAMLHELAQRMFPRAIYEAKLNVFEADQTDLSGENGIQFLTSKLQATPQNGQLTVYLRKSWESSTGHMEKDWKCEVTQDGLSVATGQPGHLTRGRSRKASTCQNGNPVEEVICMASEKLRNGYRLLPENCVFQ